MRAAYRRREGPPKRAILAAALDLLSRREYSCVELSAALSRRGYEAEPIEAIVKRMTDNGLQSDERRAASLVRVGAQRGRGQRRVAADARVAGLTEEQLSAALEQEPTDWLAQARRVAERAFGPAPYTDRAIRHKVMNKLLQRGFEMDMARRVAQASADDFDDGCTD